MQRIAIRALALWLIVLSVSSISLAQLRISVSFGPPPIPVYEQPICPGEGYIWTPGYWAWDDDDGDYYWVPGTWVLAPEVGFLWTPPWWGWEDGVYLFHAGWWGPTIGFYGGINYGFGYFGVGYAGGRWEGDRFYYNRSVTNINVVNIRNVYNETVVNNTATRVSFNGGPGGIQARPRPEEERAAQGRHIAPVAAQTEHIQQARSNRELRASFNNGRPPIAATARPRDFSSGAVPAREAGGPYRPPANRGGAARGGAAASNNPVHPRDLAPFQRPGPANSGNPAQDRKYQQQMDKMYAKQEQERQKLQQKQEQEHRRMERQNAPAPQRQQLEQRHQQQTQQLQQRHIEQQQHMQQRQPGGRR